MNKDLIKLLGLDPDKEVVNLGRGEESVNSPDQVVPYHPDYKPEVTLPYRRGAQVPSEPVIPETQAEPIVELPVVKEPTKSIQPKGLPKLNLPSLEDRQADAIAKVEAMEEIKKEIPKQSGQQQQDSIARYMDLLSQIKKDEEAALAKGKEELNSARKRDTLAQLFAGLASAGATMHGKTIDPKTMYAGQIGQNAKADYEEILRQYGQKRKDLTQDLQSKSMLQALRKGDSDFQSTEKFRDPSSEASQLYRDMFRERNPKIPISDNLSAEDIEKLLKAQGNNQMTEYRQAYLAFLNKQLELSQRKADQADERIGIQRGAQDRLLQQFEHKKKEQDELPEKVQEKIATNLNLAAELTDMENDENLYAISGPLMGRLHEFKRFIGVDSPEGSAAQANAVNIIADYIQKRSGVAVSDKEREFLMGALPSIYDKPETIKAVLQQMRRRLQNENRALLETYRITKNVEPYQQLFSDYDSIRGSPKQRTGRTGKTLVKKQYSPSANKTKLIYQDGSEEIVDGRQ